MASTKFRKLYNDWYKAICFLSTGLYDVQEWKNLVEWSKQNTDKAVDGVIEVLRKEPSHVVKLCDELFPDLVKVEGYVSLEFVCNMWLNLLIWRKRGELDNPDTNNFAKGLTNYYEDYDAYHEYMKDNYIPWNPFKEDDPNVTLEEFKRGKRNDTKILKNRK